MLRASCRLRFACSSAALLAFGLVILLQPAQPIRRGSHAPLGPPSLAQGAAVAGYRELPLQFELNQGQTDRRVRFLSRGAGYTLFLTDSEAVLQMLDGECGVRKESTPLPRPPASMARKPHPCSASVVRMKLTGANPSPQVVPRDQLPGRSNYFIGNDPSTWRTNVPSYRKVEYRGVYPGVDLVYYGNQGQLEYDFVVAPGADPRQIRLEFNGAGNLGVEQNGDLIVGAAGQTVRFRRPVVYQEADGRRRQIAGRYVLRGKRGIAFDVASYDTSRRLVIDPVLVYSTYLGGSGNDYGQGIAVDLAGNAYVAGITSSTDFPTTTGLAGTFGGGSYDAFVAKLNAADSALVYSTYLGGRSSDGCNSIAVDTAGNAYVTGYTSSTNFPTANPLQATYRGTGSLGSNAFVAKLNASGSRLLYSTYLGGSGHDYGYGIAVDSAGNAYVTGSTSSTDFPAASPGQPRNGGSYDAFVAKVNAAGSALVYSTYLGGSAGDYGYGIAVDSAGNACLTGYTYSANFPTASPLQASFGGGYYDAFVAKLNAAGSALVYSTYFGGSSDDWGRAVAVDLAGNAYVTGYTDSKNFPTVKPLQPAIGGPQSAFVAKLNPAGSALVYSTYLGGSGQRYGISAIATGSQTSGIAVDSAGNAYVTGITDATNFPTVNPLQATYGGPSSGSAGDAFVAKLNPAGSALVYSTYLGGRGVDSGAGIAADSAGNVYITGHTMSADFPAINSVQTAYRGLSDAFIAKISPDDAGVAVGPGTLAFPTQVINTTSAPQTVRLTSTGTSPLNIASVVATGDFAQANNCGMALAAGASCTIGVTFTPTAEGTRTGAVTVSDNANNSPQTISLTGTGTPGPVVALSATGLTFEGQLVGTTSAARVATLTNIGTAVLSITSITITESNSSDFGQANNCGASVAAGASCTISVTFTPKAAGTRRASLAIRDNASGSPQTITLTGAGIGIPIITELTPDVVQAGQRNLTMYVHGQNFSPLSVIQWDGAGLPTTFSSASLIRAPIPDSYLLQPARHQVAVSTPGFPLAGPVPFTVYSPPAIFPGGVVNAATGRSASTSASSPVPLAPGTIASVYGVSLAIEPTSASSFPLPNTLSTAEVLCCYAVSIPLLYASPSQINFIVPFSFTVPIDLAFGSRQLLVRMGWLSQTNTEEILIGQFSPGIFTTNQSGGGQGAVLIAGTGSVAAPLGALPGSRPAGRGEYISIYATGLGAVTNPPSTGTPALSSPLSLTTTQPVVTIGGLQAPISFSGVAPGFFGLYQVNGQIPAGAPSGDAVPVVITMTDAKGQKYASNEVTMAVQ